MIIHVISRPTGEPVPTGLCGKPIDTHSMYVSDSRTAAIRAAFICPECHTLDQVRAPSRNARSATVAAQATTKINVQR